MHLVGKIMRKGEAHMAGHARHLQNPTRSLFIMGQRATRLPRGPSVTHWVQSSHCPACERPAWGANTDLITTVEPLTSKKGAKKTKLCQWDWFMDNAMAQWSQTLIGAQHMQSRWVHWSKRSCVKSGRDTPITSIHKYASKADSVSSEKPREKPSQRTGLYWSQRQVSPSECESDGVVMIKACYHNTTNLPHVLRPKWSWEYLKLVSFTVDLNIVDSKEQIWGGKWILAVISC